MKFSPHVPHVVLFAGTALVSRLIRLQTRDTWTHAALVFRSSDDVLTLYEARERHGVIRRRWGHFGYPDRGYIVRVLADPRVLDAGGIQTMRRFLDRQVGAGYDYRQVFRFVTRIPGVHRSSVDRWFCSELVYAAFRSAGVELLTHTAAHEVTPGLLARTPALRTLE